tara:strand:+ start:548 stop:802 length:255 start_codon:yes stop_codon:yes gene_type:complete
MKTINISRVTAYLRDELDNSFKLAKGIEDDITLPALDSALEVLNDTDTWVELIENLRDGHFECIGYEELGDLVLDYRYQQSLED